MQCEDVRRTVSDGDRRALRGRRVRAHLRDCALCGAFAAAIPGRRDDLQALVPVLAPAASAAMLARVIGAGSGHGAGGGAGAVAAGAAGKTLGATLAAKALLGTAVLVTAAAGVTSVRAVLTNDHHDTLRPPGARSAGGPDTRGVAGRAVRPATSARFSMAGGHAANGAHRAALGRRAPSAVSTPSGQSVGRGSTGSAGVSAALPSQAHGTPAQSVAGGQRSPASPSVGRHASGPPASGQPSDAGASHTPGGSGSHSPSGSGSHTPSGSGSHTPSGSGSHTGSGSGSQAATGAGAGSPRAGTPATPGAPSAPAGVSVPASTTTTPAPSPSHPQISPPPHPPSGNR
jgi:hypothetical protein